MTKLHFIQKEVLIEDDEYITLKDTKGKTVLEGDHYHDKINEKIDGFVTGLAYLGYEADIIEIN